MKAMHRGEYLYAVQLEQKILTACASQPGFSPFFLKKNKIKLILKDLRSLSFIYNSPIFLYSSVVTRRDPLFPCPLEERNALITLATISFRFYAESNCFVLFCFTRFLTHRDCSWVRRFNRQDTSEQHFIKTRQSSK